MGKPDDLVPKGKAEPRFDIDYAYGRQGELQIGEFLEWIAQGNGQVEVKRKRILDFEFYVETHCDKGRKGSYQPSGISVTTAKAWAFVLGDIGLSVIFPTELLRRMLDDPTTRDKEESHGSCPTKGKLVSLAVLLYREKRRLQPPPQPQPQGKECPPGPPAAAPPVPPDPVPRRVDRELMANEITWG